MTTPENTLGGGADRIPSMLPKPTQKAVLDFISIYDARIAFFADSFIKKVTEGNRKALAELLRHPLPPTQMDLRREFSECVKMNLSPDCPFMTADGKLYTMKDLATLVPMWASIAEKALMDSDPALADKLMSPVQWNAKSAFEVTFVTASDELRDIKKTKHVPASMDHYMKWVIGPLKKALEEVKRVNPPGNALIGFVKRMPLRDAIALAETLEAQFRKAVEQKSR